MPRLRFTTFDGVTHHHELKTGTTRIGRTADNDLQIDELEVTSHHAELTYDGQSLRIRDLGSIGGTYLNGQPITEASLETGQILSLGTFLIHVEPSAGRPAPPPLAEQQPVQLSDGSYSCLRHPDRRALYECEDCFDLACESCVRRMEKAAGQEIRCGKCGSICRAIDWSGLDVTKASLLKEMFIPKRIKRAAELWDRHVKGKPKSQHAEGS